MAIFEERILEPFVNKGLGNSGIASRDIQVSNLPSLRGNIAQSAATRSNIQKSRLFKSFKSNTPRLSGGGGGSGRGGLNQTVLLGRTRGSEGSPSTVLTATKLASGKYSIGRVQTGHSLAGDNRGDIARGGSNLELLLQAQGLTPGASKNMLKNLPTLEKPGKLSLASFGDMGNDSLLDKGTLTQELLRSLSKTTGRDLGATSGDILKRLGLV